MLISLADEDDDDDDDDDVINIKKYKLPFINGCLYDVRLLSR